MGINRLDCYLLSVLDKLIKRFKYERHSSEKMIGRQMKIFYNYRKKQRCSSTWRNPLSTNYIFDLNHLVATMDPVAGIKKKGSIATHR